MERAEVGSEYFGVAQDRIENFARHVIPANPAKELGIRPQDHILRVDHNHAVGHAVQHALVLEQLAHAERFAQMSRRDVHTIHWLSGDHRQSA